MARERPPFRVAAWRSSTHCAICGDARRSPESRYSPSLKLTNPLDIGFALKFGLLFALILALVRGSYERLGTGGVYATGFLAGLEGLDAITLSVGRLVPETITGKR